MRLCVTQRRAHRLREARASRCGGRSEYATSVGAAVEKAVADHCRCKQHPTRILIVGTGLLFAGSATQAADPAKFQKLLRGSLKLAIFVEFFLNFYVLPFAVELIFIPLLVVLVCVNVVVERDPKHADVRRLIDGVLSVIAVSLLIFVATSAIRDRGGLFSLETAEQLLVAPALTLASVALLYLVAVWSTYEAVFARIDISVKDKQLARRTKWAMVATLHARAPRAGARSAALRSARRALLSARAEGAGQRLWGSAMCARVEDWGRKSVHPVSLSQSP